MTNLAAHRGLSWRIRVRAVHRTFALVIVLWQPMVLTRLAEAQAYTTFTVLYSFKGGTDGSSPFAGLVRDGAGNLYGTTLHGGGSDFGTVYKLDSSGAETVLHSFTGVPDGQYPQAGLVLDSAGNFYGTTGSGGASGFGTVFKLDTKGAETVLHSFTYMPDGAFPSGLVGYAAGNLYGTAAGGGAFGTGTVFKLNAAGKLIVLHNFRGGATDGQYPYAGLVRDPAGNFYGTTFGGGASGLGTVFKLDTTGVETVLHSFAGTGGDGTRPYAALRDAAGNLYGTTSEGGASGLGTVFKMDTTGAETVLHSFTDVPDGASPYAGLVADAAGNLYGTTAGGGAFGMGTVFKLNTAGKLTVLHSFTGGATDGGHPLAGLVRDAAGNLYGTTYSDGFFGLGTVFKLSR